MRKNNLEIKGRMRARLPGLLRRTGQNNNKNKACPKSDGPPKSLNQLASLPFGYPDSKPVKSNVPAISCAILASVTTGGTSYAFSLYGGALKHSLHLTQAQLATISSANFLAGFFSWIPGLIVDRFGERFSLILGGSIGAISLVYFWAVATRLVDVPRSLIVVTLSSLGILIFLAVSLVTGSVFKAISSTCGPNTKGAVVGAAKGYVGVGAGAYAILFESLGRKNDLDCLLMIAGLNVLATTLPAVLLLTEKLSDDVIVVDDLSDHHLNTMYLGLMGLGVLVVGQSVASLYQEDDEKDGLDFVQFFLLLGIWMGPICSLLIHPRLLSSAPTSSKQTINADEEIPLKSDKSQQIPFSGSTAAVPFSNEGTSIDSYNEIDKKTDNVPDPPDETILVVNATPVGSGTLQPKKQYELFEMLSTYEAWLLLWTCTILTGGGTLMTNNMAQMSESLSLHDNVTPAALALFCAAQAFSRVATGVVSDACLQRYNWARPYFLVLASIATCIAHLVLAFAIHEISFVIGVVLAGIAFGMIWPLVVLIVGELFGTRHIGANYMFYDGFDSAIGTLLISMFIAGYVYEQHLEAGKDETTCYGKQCFQITHLAVAALSIICILTSLCLMKTKIAKRAYAQNPASVKRPLRKRIA
mmetsp:Transcript_2559/g.3893  ORF Transcript_2559/g.3893 Transcript_2559/m.3893 type:complete len:642 (+) Transcript_2559:121-2046(+)